MSEPTENPDMKTLPRDGGHPIRPAFPPDPAADVVARVLEENPDIAVRALLEGLRRRTPAARELLSKINAR